MVPVRSRFSALLSLAGSAKSSKRQAQKKKAEELVEARVAAGVEAELGPGRKMTAAEEKAWKAWSEKDPPRPLTTTAGHTIAHCSCAGPGRPCGRGGVVRWRP